MRYLGDPGILCNTVKIQGLFEIVLPTFALAQKLQNNTYYYFLFHSKFETLILGTVFLITQF